MDPALANYGWTDEQWNRICATVTEEAQRARVAAQLLPLTGPEDASVLAVPRFSTKTEAFPPPAGFERLTVDSDPDLYVTRIAINVYLRSHEMADPQLNAALQMFRRAANHIARLEDALVFYGRTKKAKGTSTTLIAPPAGILPIYEITEDAHGADGIFESPAAPAPLPKQFLPAKNIPTGGAPGDGVFKTIVSAIDKLEEQGFLGPFACALGHDLFEQICTPNPSLVLPRDRILPFLQGPLLRSSAIRKGEGVVVSLAGNPVELIVAQDISVSFLQTSPEPRWVFLGCPSAWLFESKNVTPFNASANDCRGQRWLNDSHICSMFRPTAWSRSRRGQCELHQRRPLALVRHPRRARAGG